MRGSDAGAQKLFAEALQHHERGRAADAARLCNAVLRMSPAHAGAHHVLGLIALQAGHAADALRSIDRSLESNPNLAHVHSHRAVALLQLGRPQESLESSQRALLLDPRFAGAYNNRGSALSALGRTADAIASFERALSLTPGSVNVLNNLGLALVEAGQTERALRTFDEALRVAPNHPGLHSRRAAALTELGRFDAARLALQKALAIEPSLCDAHNQMGYLDLRLERFEEALSSFDRVLAIDPRSVPAMVNRASTLLQLRRPEDALVECARASSHAPDLADVDNARGSALFDLQRFDEAVAAFNRATALRPDFAEAHSNLAGALLGQDRPEAAAESCRRALQIRPDLASALIHLGNALTRMSQMREAAACYARVVALEPDHDYALGELLFARLRTCDWSDYDELRATIRAKVAAGERATYPFAHLTVAEDSFQQLACARTLVADRHRVAALPRARARHAARDRLRVAYLSADFRDHATAYLMARLFELHDRSRFEVTAVSFGPERAGLMRERLLAAFEHFIDVRAQSDRAVAEELARREIDIAVDLKGFTTGSRPGILARRPAPIQVSYLGFPGTMGAPFVDYILADREVIPPADREFFAEQVVYLPGCYQVNDDRREVAHTLPTRREAGLPERGFVFCSFNNCYKFTPQVFDVWMRLLASIQGSVLWLIESNAAARENLLRAAARRGIDDRRLVFAKELPLAEHLARFRLADLFLDTLPVNAHTTASDALWTGVPVLTCRGRTFAGRVAASLLQAVGLPELVTDDLASYEQLAARLANDAGELGRLRERLEGRDKTALFDTDRSRRYIEAAYREMWERHQRGESPAGFALNE